MDIIKALEWRYATKKFDSEAIIPEETIALLKHAFNLTASSYGLQPVKLLLVSNKSTLNDLVPLSMNQKQVGQASHLCVFCVETNIDEAYIRAFFDRIISVNNTPDEVLNPFRTSVISSFEQKSEDDIFKWGAKQAYLAMGNMLTVCATQGVDACPMEGFDPTEYDRYLKLNEQGLRSVLVMPIGYRATDDMFGTMNKVRKPLNESIIELK
ncbi:NAD(P)H-dependent oxidoreductase [Flavobacteriaceae bacterium]|jgi:nitroreductase/dihydropteridine reductase|nr:NAD(P)H-dependent oxidoreductase [Flavobacteriaceae bacterium]MDA7849194.1 NAD(P)H-dependent oxidoreductase [Flavobacteriaceae bacterium]|tara:strand:- start:11587 stop:12219 length:633 start_codon:yes stop_codon:yes gene_type:complete